MSKSAVGTVLAFIGVVIALVMTCPFRCASVPSQQVFEPQFNYVIRASNGWSVSEGRCHHYTRDGNTYTLLDESDGVIGEVTAGGEWVVLVRRYGATQ